MCKSFISLNVVVILLLLLTVSATAASPPQDVSIVAESVFGEPSEGTFTASGAAVEAGLICSEGTTLDLEVLASGYQSGRGINYLVTKLFACDDGSGTLTAQLAVRVDFKGDNANWLIIGGTGAYEKLHGSGTLVGIYYPDFSGVTDYYTGKVHQD